MEKAIFHAMHSQSKPKMKEINESLAFVNATRSAFKGLSFDVVLDVAGGHGAVAALFLCLCPGVNDAVVIDPADVPGGRQGVAAGIVAQFVRGGKTLTYRAECLRTGLPTELLRHAGKRVLVVACHACQHLTDEIVSIALAHGAAGVSVMPCCHKDQSGAWKTAAKLLGVGLGTCMDLALAGRIVPEGRLHGFDYEVRVRTAAKANTPQNRIVIGRRLDKVAQDREADADAEASVPTGPNRGKVEASHERLTRAYDRAHRPAKSSGEPPRPAQSPPLTIGAWARARSWAAAGLSWDGAGRWIGCAVVFTSIGILSRGRLRPVRVGGRLEVLGVGY